MFARAVPQCCASVLHLLKQTCAFSFHFLSVSHADGSNESCTITVLRGVVLTTVGSFGISQSSGDMDAIAISSPYAADLSTQASINGRLAYVGATITWQSSALNNDVGWTICAQTAVPTTAPSLSAAPTPPVPSPTMAPVTASPTIAPTRETQEVQR
jgi:hypothetical protein